MLPLCFSPISEPYSHFQLHSYRKIDGKCYLSNAMKWVFVFILLLFLCFFFFVDHRFTITTTTQKKLLLLLLQWKQQQQQMCNGKHSFECQVFHTDFFSPCLAWPLTIFSLSSFIHFDLLFLFNWCVSTDECRIIAIP